MTGMHIDVHILQSVPPSNINRDDTGSPKTAFYGGVRRARVSSQAWKKSTRHVFNELLQPDQLGFRTKHVVALIKDRITEKAGDLAADAQEMATAALGAAGIALSKPRANKNAASEDDPLQQSNYLLFLSFHQVDRLADLAIQAQRAGAPVDKKAARAAADQGHSIDVSLFGRMVADAADLNVDAAAQVAHAISVHAVENEFDYFTAVDDKNPEDSSGAGMIGTVEFNSSTLYRYATVNVPALRANLGDDDATTSAVRAFLRAFICSMPTGKQNTFANRTLPDAVVVRIRQDQPVNLVGAFEDAVTAMESRGRLSVAVDRLVEHSLGIDAAYGDGGGATYVIQTGPATKALAELGDVMSLESLVERVGDEVDSLAVVAP